MSFLLLAVILIQVNVPCGCEETVYYKYYDDDVSMHSTIKWQTEPYLTRLQTDPSGSLAASSHTVHTTIAVNEVLKALKEVMGNRILEPVIPGSDDFNQQSVLTTQETTETPVSSVENSKLTTTEISVDNTDLRFTATTMDHTDLSTIQLTNYTTDLTTLVPTEQTDYYNPESDMFHIPRSLFELLIPRSMFELIGVTPSKMRQKRKKYSIILNYINETATFTVTFNNLTTKYSKNTFLNVKLKSGSRIEKRSDSNDYNIPEFSILAEATAKQKTNKNLSLNNTVVFLPTSLPTRSKLSATNLKTNRPIGRADLKNAPKYNPNYNPFSNQDWERGITRATRPTRLFVTIKTTTTTTTTTTKPGDTTVKTTTKKTTKTTQSTSTTTIKTSTTTTTKRTTTTTTTTRTTTTTTTPTPTTTTTTTTTTTVPIITGRIRRTKTRTRRSRTTALNLDLAKLMALVSNLTMSYQDELALLLNKSLDMFTAGTCPTPTTPTTTAPTTTVLYENLTGTIMGKCFVCGLTEEKIPNSSPCADAFDTDFIPLVPVDPTAKGQVSKYRKYCRWMNVPRYVIKKSDSRAMWGRWTGGCAVRWIDISGIYTQRTCRNRHRAIIGRHWVSKRMAKLEMALQHIDNGCIISPAASLVPFSRGVSLYARFHVCVCTGSWCNVSTWNKQWTSYYYITFLIFTLRGIP